MSQTSYSVDMAVGREGQLADSGDNDVLSRVAKEAIPFGKLVVEGAAEGEALLPALATDVTNKLKVLGLALLDHTIPQDGGSVDQHASGDMISVMRKGRAIVKVEQAVAVTDPVYVRYAAGGNGLGSFGMSAGTSERALLANAKYVKGASSGGLAVVELNLAG